MPVRDHHTGGLSQRTASSHDHSRRRQNGTGRFARGTGLFGEAISQAAKLFQNEIVLAKAELAEHAQTMGAAIGFLVGGAVLVIPALVMTLFALSAALISAGWSQPLSYLASAVVAAALAGLLVAIGMNRLDARKLIPRETLRQLEKDKNTVKGMAR